MVHHRNLFPTMKPSKLSVLTTILAILALVYGAKERRVNTQKVMVMGSVFCSPCSQNTFSKHSHFLQGKKPSSSSKKLSLDSVQICDHHSSYLTFEIAMFTGVAAHVECNLTAGLKSERNFTFSATRKTELVFTGLHFPLLMDASAEMSVMWNPFVRPRSKKALLPATFMDSTQRGRCTSELGRKTHAYSV